ncbi:MAG: cytochrome c oxidase accessory protein CcoG [Deltaproteobacteria bacterium]|nr:cytochrome c oxidase accessory protein CcoG [Deltaproteobacteria bacterium]
MSKSLVEPTQERPTTISESGSRQWLYPASFAGAWLNRRTVVNVVLMALFFGLPWLEVGGHQAVLLDLPRRKLAFFGLVLWPQDSYLLWLLLFTAIVGIFFITSQWGRLWCGWACPQTVFMEGVFRRIETWIEGDANKRKRLDDAKLDAAKIGKKLLKHAVFFVVAGHVANTFLCYFASSERVVEMTLQSPASNPGWFAFMAAVNFVFYADFAWFREQLCTIACPYGRWQSVLLDEHSLIVGYDRNRGESRGTKGDRRKNPEQSYGDCIDCGRCVAVCPTGIDIRNGLQMECINCTACIDACDDIMVKVGKPTGLVRYTSLEELDGKDHRFVRPRTIGYGLVLVIVITVFAVVASNRKMVEAQVVRASGPSVVTVADGWITNHFRAKLVNKRDEEARITLRPQAGYDFRVPMNPWPVAAGKTATMEIFVRRKLDDFKPGGGDQVLFVFEHEGEEIARQRAPLLGPGMAGRPGGR